jgi:hypothetical protein
MQMYKHDVEQEQNTAYQQRPYVRRLNPWRTARGLEGAHGAGERCSLARMLRRGRQSRGNFWRVRVCASAL